MQEFNYFQQEGVLNNADVFLGEEKLPAKNILEAAAPNSAVSDFAGQQTRSAAMACVLAWIEGGDFSYSAMQDGCFMIADLNEDEDLSPDEEDTMNEMLQECANALTSLGADSANVSSFMDDEDDAAGAILGAYLAEKVNATEDDDETIIANYAVGGDVVLESMVKVIRGGKVALKRKRIGRPKKMTSLQRAGLAKARRKAFTGAAKVARAKSMRIRKSRGM